MNTAGIDTRLPFVSALVESHYYRTSRPPRQVLFPNWIYYRGILKIILVSSWIARNGKFSNQNWFDRSYYAIKLVESIGGDIEITGVENLAALTGPAVVVCNHMSLLETFLLPSILIPFTPMCVVIKKELTEYPGFGKVMRTVNHIAVSRDNPRADFRVVMEKGLDFLKSGISVLIFPQSTRNSVFVPSEFNTLGEKLAAKAGVPVIPIAVKTDLHGNGQWLKEFGAINPALPVRLAIGGAVDPRTDPRQAHDAIIRFISGKLHGWGLPVQDPQPAAPSPP